MKRVRQRIKEVTPKTRCHADVRDIIGELNPILRGWGGYFRTGKAANKFRDIDRYVWQRLKTLRVKQKGRHLKPGDAARWSEDYFHSLGLLRLGGTILYPEPA